MNNTGQFVIKPKYLAAEPFSEGLALEGRSMLKRSKKHVWLSFVSQLAALGFAFGLFAELAVPQNSFTCQFTGTPGTATQAKDQYR